MAGVLAVRDPALADRIYFVQNAEGTALGPQDAWLLIRGLKTMSLRMERQAANAQRIAEWLAAHPLVACVNFPGLPGHPGKAVHDAQVRLRLTAGGRLSHRHLHPEREGPASPLRAPVRPRPTPPFNPLARH